MFTVLQGTAEARLGEMGKYSGSCLCTFCNISAKNY